MKYNLNTAYSDLLTFAKSHYENFPVVSFLIPEALRKHVAVVYWFARMADDYADEGKYTEDERLIKLNNFERRLSELLEENYENNFEAALSNTIITKNLSPEHFYNLLSAFKQDVIKKRYPNYAEVLDYCRRSANPVGRLILELFNIKDEKAASYSDKICTALQLTNFYQDTKIDYEKGRIYLPVDEMGKFGVDENMFEKSENNINLKKLLMFNIDRTKDLFKDGRNLLTFLKGRLKFEIKWTILGGERILKKIENNDYDVLRIRPVLTKPEVFGTLIKAFL
jgi:squalene synthase HpnC